MSTAGVLHVTTFKYAQCQSNDTTLRITKNMAIIAALPVSQVVLGYNPETSDLSG